MSRSGALNSISLSRSSPSPLTFAHLICDVHTFLSSRLLPCPTSKTNFKPLQVAYKPIAEHLKEHGLEDQGTLAQMLTTFAKTAEELSKFYSGELTHE